MTEQRLNHKLDISKIKTIEDIKNVFDTMSLVASMSEDNELYEIAKEYFTIPYVEPKLEFKLPRKSLEEISQECEEKFDKHIESIKHKFAELKCHQEYLYNQKFNRIIENFEYAKEHGQFPVRLTIGNLDCSNLIANNNTVSWSTEFRIGKDEVGWWDIKPNIKVYLEKKPNRIVRYFSKLLLDFTWKDK
jgi:hypothetical protein